MQVVANLANPYYNPHPNHKYSPLNRSYFLLKNRGKKFHNPIYTRSRSHAWFWILARFICIIAYTSTRCKSRYVYTHSIYVLVYLCITICVYISYCIISKCIHVSRNVYTSSCIISKCICVYCISRIVYVYMRYEKSSSVYIRISQRSRSVKSRNAGLTTRNSYATLAKLA